MKKFILLSAALMFLAGCGSDGDDGFAYLSFAWDWTVDAYYDNNPDIPYTIDDGSNYRVYPGRYFYEYSCSDGAGSYWGYEGYYLIDINLGEDGGIFRDGDDGADPYLLLGLWSEGISYDVIDYKAARLVLGPSNSMDTSRFTKVYTGEPEIEEHTSGRGTLLIERQRFELIER